MPHRRDVLAVITAIQHIDVIGIRDGSVIRTRSLILDQTPTSYYPATSNIIIVFCCGANQVRGFYQEGVIDIRRRNYSVIGNSDRLCRSRITPGIKYAEPLGGRGRIVLNEGIVVDLDSLPWTDSRGRADILYPVTMGTIRRAEASIREHIVFD